MIDLLLAMVLLVSADNLVATENYKWLMMAQIAGGLIFVRAKRR